MNEFQVIILAAGKGSRLREITSNKPKCLLPIGIYPMVYYPMKMFEKAGFKEVYVVVSETTKSEVEFTLEQTDLNIKYILISVPYEAEDKGTSYSLRCMSSYITNDFIVVSCDLLSTIDVKSILNFHKKTDASLTALYFHGKSTDRTIIVPGSKLDSKIERDLVGIDPATNRLVFSASASDYMKNLRIGKNLLHKHGKVRMHTSLLDAHFYVMKKWLIKYLVHNEKLTTVKGELIPSTVRMQMSSKNKLLPTAISTDITPMKDDCEKKNDIDIFAIANEFGCDVRAQSISSFNDHCGDLDSFYLNDNIRCYAYIDKVSFGLRCNSMREFCRANKLIIEKWREFANNESNNVSFESKIESNQFENETCFVAAKTTVESKTFIATSTFGSGCYVQQKTKITGCIIMNNVKINEGCTLHNCIICDDVTIGSNCSLKDCFVGYRYVVPDNGTYKNEIIAEIENFMEVS